MIRIVVFILACACAITGWRLYEVQGELSERLPESPKVAVIDWGDVMNVSHYQDGAIAPAEGIRRTNSLIAELASRGYLVLDSAAAIRSPASVHWDFGRIMEATGGMSPQGAANAGSPASAARKEAQSR